MNIQHEHVSCPEYWQGRMVEGNNNKTVFQQFLTTLPRAEEVQHLVILNVFSFVGQYAAPAAVHPWWAQWYSAAILQFTTVGT